MGRSTFYWVTSSKSMCSLFYQSLVLYFCCVWYRVSWAMLRQLYNVYPVTWPRVLFRTVPVFLACYWRKTIPGKCLCSYVPSYRIIYMPQCVIFQENYSHCCIINGLLQLACIFFSLAIFLQTWRWAVRLVLRVTRRVMTMVPLPKPLLRPPRHPTNTASLGEPSTPSWGEILMSSNECNIHQWIRLDKLYKLEERFFFFFKFWNHFLNKLKKFFKIIVALDLCMQGGGGICAEQHAF